MQRLIREVRCDAQFWRRSLRLKSYCVHFRDQGQLELMEAMRKDMNKSHFQGYLEEINMVEMEVTAFRFRGNPLWFACEAICAQELCVRRSQRC